MTPLPALALALVLLAQPAADVPSSLPDAKVLATSTVGIEGRVLLRAPAGRSLVTLPAERATPVVLRIADSALDGDASIYDVRFIAQYPGRFDLREFLQYGDGSSATDLEPLVVEIGSLLPQGHTGDLYDLADSPLPSIGGYRTLLIGASVVWLVPVGWVIAKRLRKPPAPKQVESGPPRTLGDQLRPFLESAMAGTLSPEGSARLEMLLLAYWRRHRHIEGLSHKQAVARLREDDEAGELLRMLDRWLHQPPADTSAIDVAALLARYREIEPIELPERKGDSEPTSPRSTLAHAGAEPSPRSGLVESGTES